MNDFIERKPQDYVEILFYAKKLDIEVSAVHPPILAEENEFQNLENPDVQEILLKACTLAQNAAEIFNNKPIVVFHAGIRRNELKNYHSLRETALAVFAEILSKFPDVQIGLENIIPVTPKEKGFPAVRVNSFFGPAEIAEFLRKELSTGRIGTVLDTAHAIITINFLNFLKEHGLNTPIPTLKDYFTRYQQTLKSVHLAYSIGLGYFPAAHGISFLVSDEGKNCLKEILNLYSRYGNSALVVLEIIEKDYTDSRNFKEMFEHVKLFKTKELHIQR